MQLTSDIDARITALIEQKTRQRRRDRHYTPRQAIDAVIDKHRSTSALLVTWRFPLVDLYEVREELQQMLHYGVLELVPPVDSPVPFYRRRKRYIGKKVNEVRS